MRSSRPSFNVLSMAKNNTTTNLAILPMTRHPFFILENSRPCRLARWAYRWLLNPNAGKQNTQITGTVELALFDFVHRLTILLLHISSQVPDTLKASSNETTTMPLKEFMSTLALAGEASTCEIVIDRAKIPITKCGPVLRRTMSLPYKSDPNARWGLVNSITSSNCIPSPAKKSSSSSIPDVEPNMGIEQSTCDTIVDRAPRRTMSFPSLPSPDPSLRTTTAEARWGLVSPNPKSDMSNCITALSQPKRLAAGDEATSKRRDQSPDQPHRRLPLEGTQSGPQSPIKESQPCTDSPIKGDAEKICPTGNHDECIASPNNQGQKLVDLIRLLSVRAAMTISKHPQPTSLDTVLECASKIQSHGDANAVANAEV